jgi:Icc-related predicted phosphoesterase
MRFLIISDMHGVTANIEKLADEFAKADTVLFGGDFARFQHPETALPALETLVKKHESVYAVIGNCDEPDFLSEVEGADISVQNGMVFHDGLVFAGSGGGTKFSGDTPFERTEEEILADYNILKDSAAQCADADGHWNNLVLIMHNPPKDTACDLIPAGVHVGSTALRAFIEETQPLLVVTGHIHESAGIDTVGRTTVVNPGALFEGKYAVAEAEQGADGVWNITSAELKTL